MSGSNCFTHFDTKYQTNKKHLLSKSIGFIYRSVLSNLSQNVIAAAAKQLECIISLCGLSVELKCSLKQRQLEWKSSEIKKGGAKQSRRRESLNCRNNWRTIAAKTTGGPKQQRRLGGHSSISQLEGQSRFDLRAKAAQLTVGHWQSSTDDWTAKAAPEQRRQESYCSKDDLGSRVTPNDCKAAQTTFGPWQLR